MSVASIRNAFEWLDIRRLGFIVLFLVVLTGITLVDPDYFWHLRTGQYIVETGGLPVGDPYSFTAPGKPWVLHEWLFEVVLYEVYAALGTAGVKLLCAGLAIATLVVSYGTANRIVNRPTLAYILTLVFFVVAAFGISPRPQLVTYLCFAVALRVLVEFKHSAKTVAIWLLPPLMAIWVNFHGGYVSGIALMMLFCVCEWIMHLVRTGDVEQRRALKRLSIAVAAAVLATLANPYFIDHWLYPFQLMSMDAVKSYINEWQSPNFHQPWPLGYLALVLATLTAAMYRPQRPDLTEIAVATFFGVGGFIGVRHMPIAALALLPFAAESVGQMLREKSAVAVRLKPGRWQYPLNWALLALLCLASVEYYPKLHENDDAATNKFVPVKATEFIRESGLEGRMFNSYHFGGYLILRLYPAQRVFIDGRVDMYGDDLLKDYLQIIWGAPNWQSLFAAHQIDYIVVERRVSLRQLLLCRGDYKLVYDDADTSILVQDAPRYAAIIARYRPPTGETDSGRCRPFPEI